MQDENRVKLKQPGSSHVCVGLLQVFWIPPMVQRHAATPPPASGLS